PFFSRGGRLRFTLTNGVPQAVQPAEVWVPNRVEAIQRAEARGSFSVAQAFTPGNERPNILKSPINRALKTPPVSHAGVNARATENFRIKSGNHQTRRRLDSLRYVFLLLLLLACVTDSPAQS